MKSNQKFKKKGMMLLSAVLAAFLLTMVASGYFMTLTGSFNAIKSGGEAIQAQRYAEIEANKLSLLAYNDLDTKVSQNVWKKSDADEGWEYKVNLGPEKVVDPTTNSKQRIATVSVRKEGDATDRFQMKVPVSANQITKNNSNEKEVKIRLDGEKSLPTDSNGELVFSEDGFIYLPFDINSGVFDASTGDDGCYKINTKLELTKISGEKRFLPITSYYYVKSGEKLQIRQSAESCYGWYGSYIQNSIKNKRDYNIYFVKMSFL